MYERNAGIETRKEEVGRKPWVVGEEGEGKWEIKKVEKDRREVGKEGMEKERRKYAGELRGEREKG